jgi:sorting nexin-1/2
LAIVNGEFAQTISDLASSDVGAQLSQSLSGLADVERKAQELQMTQSDHDMVTIMATSDEYSRLINSVRVGLFPTFGFFFLRMIDIVVSWHSVRE